MENGKCPTWFVQKWLEKHQNHTAKASNTNEFCPSEASTDGRHVEYLTEWPPDFDSDTDGSPPIRFDWTIYNEHGRPVKFKKKPNRSTITGSHESLPAGLDCIGAVLNGMEVQIDGIVVHTNRTGECLRVYIEIATP